LLDNLDKTIVAIGTTSLRTIESLYWLGVQSLEWGVRSQELEVTQWEPYETDSKNVSAGMALNSLLGWMEKK
jgi:S-adenosylmethionine:tRNA ribosyltransferase-isomerase